MKKILAILLLILFGTAGHYSLNAQHDIGTNFLGFLFGNYSLAYEYGINESSGIRAEVSQFKNTVDISDASGEDTESEWTGFRFTPEYRVYFNPDEGGDNFFVAPYLRYRQRTLDSVILLYDVEIDENVLEEYERKATGVAVGLNLGRKWVSESGFYFEPNFGIGRYISQDAKYDNSKVEDYFENTEDVISENIRLDIRFGLNVGWRIR